MAEAVRWDKRVARVNMISPDIIMTPLAKDELSGPRRAGYRRMIEVSAIGRSLTARNSETARSITWLVGSFVP